MIDFGISALEFQQTYFERAPQLFRAALRERSFEWKDLDTILSLNEPTPQSVQLFNRGLIPHEAYTEDCSAFGEMRRRLNKVSFYGHLNAGATLVINRFEQCSLIAQRLCVEVGRFALQPSTSNAYVSFRGDGTFGPHWDTHDVFAIQLLGRKRWRVFPPTLPLPLSHQTSARSGHTCPAVPILDCVLETGDVLYVPRGFWHHVIPFDEGSVHVSVGTYAPTVYDYVMWLCSRVLPEQPWARSALNGEHFEVDEIVEQIGAALRDPTSVTQFQLQLAQRERTTSEFNLGLFLSAQTPAVSSRTRLLLNSCYRVRSGGVQSANGATLQLDALSTRILDLLTPSSLTLADLQAQLPQVPEDAVLRSVLNLNRYELLSLVS